jgi:Sec-independent protein secretion pathway component TatC
VRILRIAITSIALLLVSLDFFIVASILINGMPENVHFKTDGNALIMEPLNNDITYIDVIFIIGIIAIHMILAYSMWRLWKPRLSGRDAAVLPSSQSHGHSDKNS